MSLVIPPAKVVNSQTGSTQPSVANTARAQSAPLAARPEQSAVVAEVQPMLKTAEDAQALARRVSKELSEESSASDSSAMGSFNAVDLARINRLLSDD